eukprot:m.108860 g.108860  ORF g.108860 m.108860 type:complete len:360 (-) comp27910_c1_seq1:224-1303(-)
MSSNDGGDVEVDEDYNTDLYAAPPVTTKNEKKPAAEFVDSDDDDEADEPASYGQPKQFEGKGKVKNHVQLDEDADLYMAPPVKNVKKSAAGGKVAAGAGGKVAAMIARAKAEQAEKDAAKARVNQKKPAQTFKYQQNAAGSYLDVTPGMQKRESNEYTDVAPGPPKSAAEKIQYTTVQHDAVKKDDDDDGTYKDVAPTGPAKAKVETSKAPTEVVASKEKVQYTQVDASKTTSATPAPNLPPPSQRAADWREYKGADLGGRCKIRVYFSTTTSDRVIRANSQSLQMLLERLKVHERPDFEPWIPVDMDMDREVRNTIFEKAGTRKTPLLFIDDEFVGGWDEISDMIECDMPSFQRMLTY